MKRALIVALTLCAAGAIAQPTQQQMLQQAERMRAEADRKKLENAVQVYRAEHDQLPGTLNDLVLARYITAIPQAPVGMAFAYDPKTGAVTVAGTPKVTAAKNMTAADALNMAADLQAKANLKKIEVAINVFLSEEGQYPTSLEDLVARHLLEEIPKPPSGMKYKYNRENGKVELVPVK